MTEQSRRPLKTRQSRYALRAAQWLAEKNITPNQISMASMVFAALAALCFGLSTSSSVLWLGLAALLIQLRLLCNLLDGMVAIEGGKGDKTGPFWNEVPDRISDFVILLGMGYAAGSMLLGMTAAAGAIMTAYLREAASAQGMAADFSGPMAKPHRMAVATFVAIAAIFVSPTLGLSPWLSIGLWAIILGEIVTIFRRSKHYFDFLKSRTPKDSL